MPRQLSANDIINNVAAEVNVGQDPNPVQSTAETFRHLKALLDVAGQELVQLSEWQMLYDEYSITTQAGDTGRYALPDDFAYMVDQTGWDRTNRVAVGGPLSAQDWSYLKGRDLISQSIYASFRLNDGEIWLYPQPPPEGLLIEFEYMSRNWVREASSATRDSVNTGSDTVLFEPILIQKFLKVKYLEAIGMDAAAARIEFENMFDSVTGKDTGSPILNASRNSRGFPFLHPFYSTGDTGYGH